MITQEQRALVDSLLKGSITKQQLNNKRSDARRLNKLERSIDYAVAYEVYKYEVKNGKCSTRE